MPQGADPKENFKDYVLGTYDGQPKTPEWASEICGVDPDKIRSLAGEIATTKRVALHSSFAPARVNNPDAWPQVCITFGAMTGHIGQPGRVTGASAHVQASDWRPTRGTVLRAITFRPGAIRMPRHGASMENCGRRF